MAFYYCDQPRIERLKEAGRARRQAGLSAEPLHSSYFLDAYMANLEKPPILREALALEAKCAAQEIIIYPDELIVGRDAKEAFDWNFLAGMRVRQEQPATDQAPVPLHTAVRPGLDDSAQVLAGQREAARRSLASRLEAARPYATRPRIAERLGQEEKDCMEAGLAATIFIAGHMVIDMEWVLSAGLRGVAEAVEARQWLNAALDPSFCHAMQATARALSTWVARHAERERSLARQEADAARRTELEAMAEACEWVSREPPRTFYEALQLAWLVHALNGCDSLGRFDQYLWPYYTRDIESGALTREEAGYLLKCVWCKVLEGFGIQNLTLGGLDADGEDVSNDLTLLCLETTRDLRTPQPNLSLRVSSRTPAALLSAALDTISYGLGVPALYNDDVIVPALQGLGVPERDARGYALAGCSQVVIPGKSHFLCDDGVLNVAKCVELALNDGRDPRTGKQVGVHTGAPEELRDWEGLLGAFNRQVEHAAQMLGRCCNTTDRVFAETCGFPLRTLLMQSCLERGQGVLQGGAKYNAIQAECVGITNAADSLAAIRKLAFEDRTLTLVELAEALRRNWAGHEELALYCRNRLPKFGNDDDYVDQIYRDITRTVMMAVRAQACQARGGMITPGMVIFEWQVAYGRVTGATPDGRHAGQPLADSAGPSQGCGRRGPTAVIRSLMKVEQGLAPTCVILNLMFARDAFHTGKLAPLVETYFRGGGMQMQLNVVDRETLRQAQERPQDFRDLTVRVGGFSAYFTELDKGLQDEILSRTAW